MFQNMGRMGNKLDQPIQHKLYTLKNEMSNEGISIIGISKVNSNWSKAPIKEKYIIGRTDVLKQGELSQGITKLPFPM